MLVASDLGTTARNLVERDCSSPQRGEVGRGEIWEPTPVPPALLKAARELRKEMTDAEKLLWHCLRGKQLAGYKFRKQHPLSCYIIDIYCSAAKLAIELDGGQHNSEEGKAKDAERTAYLEQLGITVLRFWNHEVLNNLEGTLSKIWDELQGVKLPHPDPTPLGEGE